MKNFIGKVKAFFVMVFFAVFNAIKSFFYRGNDFQPVYFWVTVLMALIIYMIWERAHNEIVSISDTLLISCIGAVVTLLGIYNWNTSKNPKITMKDAQEALNEIRKKL